MNHSKGMQNLRLGIIGTLAILILWTGVSAQDVDTSPLNPKTGRAIQDGSPLPSVTRRGRCNPASTRCQLPRHRVQPSDSDLNARTESGRQLNVESSLNNENRTGPALGDQSAK